MMQIENGMELVEMAEELHSDERDEVVITYIRGLMREIDFANRTIAIYETERENCELKIAAVMNGDAADALKFTKFQIEPVDFA